MADTAEEHLPFDERAALEELERLRQGIEHYRLQRKAVGDKFEAFVGSFNKSADMQLVPVKASAPVAAPAAAPASPEPPAPPAAAAPAAAAPAANIVTTAASSEPVMDPLTARLRGIPSDAWATPSTRPAPVEEVETQPAVTPAPSKTPRLAVLAFVVVVLAAAIGWSLWPRGAAPSSSPGAPAAPAPAATTPPAVPTAPPQVPPPATPAVAAPAAVPSAEVITTRTVWLRVIVDGERVLERQLPADTRVPLTAQKTIVIRTGDAGALRVSIAGQDQGPIGKDGQVVNRSFTMPAKAER